MINNNACFYYLINFCFRTVLTFQCWSFRSFWESLNRYLLDSLSQKCLHIRATKRAKIYKMLFWYKIAFMFELTSFYKFWCVWTFLPLLGPKIPTRCPRMERNWRNLKDNVFYQTAIMKKSSVCKISAVKTAF